MLALWNWLAPWALFVLAALWQIVDHAARLLLVGMLLRRFWDEEVEDERARTDADGSVAPE